MEEVPTEEPEAAWIAVGFTILSDAREWTQGGPLAIRLSEMAAWLDETEVIDGDMRREFISGVRVLDRSWLHRKYEDLAEGRKSKGSRAKKSREVPQT